MTTIQFNLILKRLEKLENDVQSVIAIALIVEGRTAVLRDAIIKNKYKAKHLEKIAHFEALIGLEKLTAIYSDHLKHRRRALKKARKGNGHSDL